jgi:hypothetical protein
MIPVGDALAILGSPAIGGAYTAAFTATVYSGRALPINVVMEHANRGLVFGSVALVPASIIGFLAELAFNAT